MSEVCRVFKLAGHDSLFVATFDLASEARVRWIDNDLVSRTKDDPVAKPFAGFTDFDDCVQAQLAAGKDEEAAKNICGALQAEAEKMGGCDVCAKSDPTKPCPACGTVTRATAKRFIVRKADDEERFVLGVVLEPDVVDAQNDTYSAEEVRMACHKYMHHFKGNTLMHREDIKGRVVLLENYIAPEDFTMEGEDVKKGTWLQGYRVVDDDLWTDVKAGDLTGLSIGGSAVRTPEN